MAMIPVYILAWLPMVFIAIANGIARDQGYKRHFTELRAHQLSTLSGMVLFAIYTWAVSLRWPLASSRQAVAVGAIWFALTITFELVFGHFVAKFTWRRLAMDYNLLKGRVWLVLLVWVAALPWVIHRLRS